MSASLRPVGIKLGDGLGDFMKFTTDDVPDGDPTGSAVGEGDVEREPVAGALGPGGDRPARRYYGARSTGIH